MASLFIRCDDEVWLMARALAKDENRSVTKQLIHMIRVEAEKKGIKPEKEIEFEEKTEDSSTINDSLVEEKPIELKEKPNLINTLEGLMEKLQEDEDITEQKGLTKLVETRKQSLDSDPKNL